MIIQLTGLSGAGKTTISQMVKRNIGCRIKVLDGDEFRKENCNDLGFSKADRLENIRRMGVAAKEFEDTGWVPIIAAINPYEEGREFLSIKYGAKLVWIKANIQTVVARDTKGLYKRASLPIYMQSQRINNLTGINDPFEEPENADLVICTDYERVEVSAAKLGYFIIINSGLHG